MPHPSRVFCERVGILTLVGFFDLSDVTSISLRAALTEVTAQHIR